MVQGVVKMSTFTMSPTINDIIATYITTGQVASLLNVNRLTVRRWLKSGRFTGYRIGNFTLISRLQVEELIVERQ